jgi:sulfatase modifying factor 1
MSFSRRAFDFVAVGAALALLGCKKPAATEGTAESASAEPGSSFGPPKSAPTPRKGMVWVNGGALVAGTPTAQFPRIADEEMPGEQVILRGFYVDVFPYPNEEGAIPLTNVSQAEAMHLCQADEKRLCTELEWERACKGPESFVYEYGNSYRSERCGTGAALVLRPNGLNVACRSEFGVRDMHGGVWEWTASKWGRGIEQELGSLRGGNAPQGELVGRCANGMGRRPETKAGNIGFRCCAGAANTAEVSLNVVRKPQKLEFREGVNKELAQAVLPLLPAEAKKEIGDQRFRFERAWIWRPIGNEELAVLGGCSGLGVKPNCGIVVVRPTLTKPQVVAWVSSGHWAPVLHIDNDPRDIWILGGDELGTFRRVIGYVWGSVSVGTKERNVPKPSKKKKKNAPRDTRRGEK